MPEYNDSLKKAVREAEEWTDKQKLLQLSEISLVLDTYDDIFSDFDPRNYDHRALSDDFLLEIKRATREKQTGVIELHFLIPVEQKKEHIELLIKRRLKDHFKKHYEQVLHDVAEVKRTGMTMIISGVFLSVFGAIFLHKLEAMPETFEQLVRGVLFFLLEPASWFLIWEGFDTLFGKWKELQPDLDFYRKMIRCEISFTGY
jgi:hypothetical protein